MGRTVIAGRYGLGALIAEDRFGEIYEAIQERLSRKVSIRLLSSNVATPEVVERFLAIAPVLSKLHHPNILFVSEFGVHEGRPYLVRDVIDGKALEHRIEQEKRISPPEATTILLEVARALDYAHQAGVVHLNLQPANILSSDGRIRVAEFGLLRIVEEEGAPADHSLIEGSRYLSPEQSAGQPADARSDLYALGVIGYRMLTGRFPYRQAKRPAPPVAESLEDPSSAKSLPSIIDRLLMKDPNDRFPTADWVLNALQRAANEIGLPEARAEDRAISVEAEVIQAPDIEGWVATTSSPGTQPGTRPSNVSSVPSSPAIEDWVVPSSAPVEKPRDIVVPEPSFWARHKENVKIAIAGLYLIGIAGATFYFSVGLPDAAEEVRGMIRRRQAAQVIPQLMQYTEEDPKLRAALGFAYVHVKDPKKAIAEYSEVARVNQAALDGSDVAAIVQLVGTTDPSTIEAEKLLLALGPRAKPKLSAAFQASADPWFRCRAGDVLTKMGEEVDYLPGCRTTLELQSCSARRIAIDHLVKLRDRDAQASLQVLASVATSTAGEDCGYREARAAIAALSEAR